MSDGFDGMALYTIAEGKISKPEPLAEAVSSPEETSAMNDHRRRRQINVRQSRYLLQRIKRDEFSVYASVVWLIETADLSRIV